MIDEAEVRGMSLNERRQLARLLAELDGHPHDERPGRPNPSPNPSPNSSPNPTPSPSPNPSPDPGALANPYLTDAKLRRQRRLALLVSAACCVVLAVWIVVIAATLPRHFDAHHWRGVWVNFDVFLLAAFAATAWAIWRERQVLILLLVGIGTMLCCDAWFDVTLDLRTSDFLVSLLMALCVELPLAALALIGARRLMRLNVRAAARTGRVPPLWKIPLYGLESRGFRTLIPAEPCPPVPPGGAGLAAVSPGPALTARGAPE